MNSSAQNVYVSASEKQGKGVFASRNFRQGERVLDIDDSHVVTDESKLTKEQHEFDLDYLSNKTVLMQEPEKYINHSCHPNTYTKTENSVRVVRAMRNIKKDEEITYDYSMNGDNDGTFECRCGSKKCRGTYQGNFFKLDKELQKQYLPYLEDWFINKHREQIAKIRS